MLFCKGKADIQYGLSSGIQRQVTYISSIDARPTKSKRANAGRRNKFLAIFEVFFQPTNRKEGAAFGLF